MKKFLASLLVMLTIFTVALASEYRKRGQVLRDVEAERDKMRVELDAARTNLGNAPAEIERLEVVVESASDLLGTLLHSEANLARPAPQLPEDPEKKLMYLIGDVGERVHGCETELRKLKFGDTPRGMQPHEQ